MRTYHYSGQIKTPVRGWSHVGMLIIESYLFYRGEARAYLAIAALIANIGFHLTNFENPLIERIFQIGDSLTIFPGFIDFITVHTQYQWVAYTNFLLNLCFSRSLIKNGNNFVMQTFGSVIFVTVSLKLRQWYLFAFIVSYGGSFIISRYIKDTPKNAAKYRIIRYISPYDVSHLVCITFYVYIRLVVKFHIKESSTTTV